MINLYVTRHGQTVWNVERKFQGRKDSPLTELGKMQALLFHERLKKLDVDIIYCSPSHDRDNAFDERGIGDTGCFFRKTL